MTWNNCINNEDSDDLQDASENAEEKKQIRMGKALSGVTGHDTHVFALSREFTSEETFYVVPAIFPSNNELFRYSCFYLSSPAEWAVKSKTICR